jgi:S1-C subfamily serine protease
MPLWEVRMETIPGSSGGPAFDAGGNLAGLVKGRFRGTKDQGYLIPVGTILEFLGAAKRGDR